MHGTGEQVEVSGPIIDKLSMVLDCEDSECQGHADYIDTLIDEYDWLQRLPTNYRGMRYRYNWSVLLNENTGARCLLQAAPYKGQFRIEFNPVKSGSSGLAALRRRLEVLLMDYAALLFAEGRVTRIDIAVDVRPVCLNYLKLYPLGLSLSSCNYGAGGTAVESVYMGSARSKLQFTIYDKYRESARSAYSDTVRFEAKIRRPMLLCDINLIANPYEKLLVSDFFDTSSVRQPPHRYLHFFDSVRQRGLHPALALILDSRTRKKYRDLFGDVYDCEWWNPQEIWSGFACEVDHLQRHLL